MSGVKVDAYVETGRVRRIYTGLGNANDANDTNKREFICAYLLEINPCKSVLLVLSVC